MSAPLKSLLQGETLQRADAHDLMATIMRGELTQAQIGAFLAAYRLRAASPGEIAGFVEAMRAACVPFPGRGEIDTCGTGGAPVKTFNVGTLNAFVLASLGVVVAKHGNKGVTSPCGSSDLMTALGVNVEMEPERMAKAQRQTNVAYLHAPRYHPAMKHAAGPRKELGVPTVFNLLGPLANPVRPAYHVLGVGAASLVRPMAEALQALNVRGYVIHGSPGMDEVSLAGPTTALRITASGLERLELSHESFGLGRVSEEAAAAVPPEQSARMTREVLAGKDGGRAAVVAASAGLALESLGRVPSVDAGASRALDAMSSGRALRTLDQFVEATRA